MDRDEQDGSQEHRPSVLSVWKSEVSVDHDSDSDSHSTSRDRIRVNDIDAARRGKIDLAEGMRGQKTGVKGDFRLAWQWVEGWRARLGKGGDIVEQARWQWRLDDRMRVPNTVPLVVAKLPSVLVASSKTGNGLGDKDLDPSRRKSVHWT